MRVGQKKIYYITGENHAAVASSPHLEYFRSKGIEVLLLSDRVDEWMVGHLTEFKDKLFQDITKGELDLDDLADSAEKEQQKALEETHKSLVERVEKALDGKVKQVRVTSRLTDSPACLVVGQYDMGGHMRQIGRAPSELQSRPHLVCRLLLEKKKKNYYVVKRVDD